MVKYIDSNNIILILILKSYFKGFEVGIAVFVSEMDFFSGPE